MWYHGHVMASSSPASRPPIHPISYSIVILAALCTRRDGVRVKQWIALAKPHRHLIHSFLSTERTPDKNQDVEEFITSAVSPGAFPELGGTAPNSGIDSSILSVVAGLLEMNLLGKWTLEAAADIVLRTAERRFGALTVLPEVEWNKPLTTDQAMVVEFLRAVAWHTFDHAKSITSSSEHSERWAAVRNHYVLSDEDMRAVLDGAPLQTQGVADALSTPSADESEWTTKTWFFLSVLFCLLALGEEKMFRAIMHALCATHPGMNAFETEECVAL